MNIHYKTITICAAISLFLVASGPQTFAQNQQNKQTQQKELTPEQKKKLIINEDYIFDDDVNQLPSSR